MPPSTSMRRGTDGMVSPGMWMGGMLRLSTENDGPEAPSWMVVGASAPENGPITLLPVAKSTVEINTLDVAGMTKGGGAGPPGAVENDSMTVAGMFMGGKMTRGPRSKVSW